MEVVDPSDIWQAPPTARSQRTSEERHAETHRRGAQPHLGRTRRAEHPVHIALSDMNAVDEGS
ncbi:hypothetical protein ODJ79_08330 [Actinoplanes sp. KI2]|uniref:hypothetical protein n=1 Tax=Actinoplanes sp. KI2 TaxID=2983315 RepID=UPI0021D5F903|nr:hypothetical protein [Actinoplanes sp. KI2]MCU7723716.1 hypothetical protein [Actinoplanes sp. KI2]